VNTVRQRFSKMQIVKWRVACVAPSVTQTFSLVFTNVKPPILGDNTFKDVPVGIDPTSWPLDANVQYTQEIVKNAGGVYPGGKFRVYGDFCWGGDKSRAEVYFLPTGQQVPTALSGTDVDQAKRTQQQLIAMGMKGTAIEASNTFVEFEAPDKDKILWGSGDQAVVRIVLYDNRAQRTTGVTADTIITLKGTTAPLPIMLILGALLGVVVLLLLIVIIVKSGGKKRGSATPPPAAPIVAGGAPPVVPPVGGYTPPGYGAPAPAPVNPEFMYGAAPGYGGNATSATLQGASGVYTLLPGQELKAGRDPAQCGIVLNEPRVSGVHATLKLENGQLFVRDENSNNGTLVNGNRIPPGVWSPVQSGSMVRFGPIEFSARLN
jgi:hypothetical protein